MTVNDTRVQLRDHDESVHDTRLQTAALALRQVPTGDDTRVQLPETVLRATPGPPSSRFHLNEKATVGGDGCSDLDLAPMSDSDPIVVLGTAGEVAALPAADRPSVPASLIARLAQYARGRLTAGIGLDQIQAPGLALPALVDAVGLGFIPADYSQALSPAEAAHLAGHDLGNAVVIPALDGNGAVVDLLAWKPGDTATLPTRLAYPPQGLVGVLAGDPTQPMAWVDRVAELGARLAAGEQRVVWCPDPGDAARCATALRERGVASVLVAVEADADADGVVAACQAAGLAITAGTPAPARLVTFDRDAHRAVYEAGGVALAIDTPWQGSTRVHALLRRDALQSAGDVDLAVPRQIAALVRSSARKLRVEPERLAPLFPADLLDQLRALEAGSGAQVVAAPRPPTPSHLDALAGDPHLVERFLADTDALGWVGDAQAKTLALLTLAGRRLPTPPWLIIRGEPSLTLPALGLLSDLVSPDHRLALTRPAEASLTHQGRDGLRERLICVPEATRLRPETVTTLAVLQARGAVAVHETIRDPGSGRLQSRLSETRGPVGLLAASAGVCPLDDLAIVVSLDDAAEQTARVLAAERERRQQGVDAAACAQVAAQWQALLAGLPAIPVRIPAANRVAFPARHPRHRVEQARFFALVEASALLHHRQRCSADGALLANEDDIRLAITATAGILGLVQDGLSTRARRVATLMAAEPDRAITIPRLADLLPQWKRAMFRGALEELMRCDLAHSPDGGRGRAARTYCLTAAPADDQGGIRLLATPVGIGEPPRIAAANISPLAQAV